MPGETVHGNLLRRIQPQLSALIELLHEAARATSSYGCILWRTAPAGSSDVKTAHLFVLADWFPDRHHVSYRLPLDSSFTGQGIALEHQQSVRDVRDEPVFLDRFLNKASVSSFCSTPVNFADGERGALNLYRIDDHPFAEADLSTAREIADILPLLFESIHDKVSFALLRAIDDVTPLLESPLPGNGDLIAFASSALEQICAQVAAAFHCAEASIFLEDRFTAPGRYRLTATTWPEISRPEYRVDPSDGITGWSLAHPDAPVRIHDLASTSEDIGNAYPGLRWADSLTRRRATRFQDDPIAVITSPVVRAGRVLGIIRCAVALGPVSFSDAAHSILQLVAARLASMWGRVLDRREAEEERASLSTLVTIMHRLNTEVAHEVVKPGVDSRRILEEGLEIASLAIPDATINDVRLLSKDGKELRFAAFRGNAWDTGDRVDVERRKKRVFPFNHGPSTSAGAYVMHTGQAYVIENTRSDPYYSETFPEATRMIVAPLQLEDRAFGVLDIRGTSEREFPWFAPHLASLVGTQLALYLKLAEVVEEVRELHDAQLHMNEDMAHQFKQPILTAHARVNEVLRSIGPGAPDRVRDSLLAARGACARAMHVTQNARLFAQLARGQTLTVEKSRMTNDDLVKMLVNTAIDLEQQHSHLPAPVRGVRDGRRIAPPPRRRFYVEPEGFSRIEDFSVDRQLLEQAVTQVLDNAFKYSFADTSVLVTGGYAHGRKSERIRISVIDEGVPLDVEDLEQCKARGWQSENVRSYTQGGSGIGLWIVDHIMRAMGGDLEVRPTDAKSRTEISLIFPVE